MTFIHSSSASCELGSGRHRQHVATVQSIMASLRTSLRAKAFAVRDCIPRPDLQRLASSLRWNHESDCAQNTTNQDGELSTRHAPTKRAPEGALVSIRTAIPIGSSSRSGHIQCAETFTALGGRRGSEGAYRFPSLGVRKPLFDCTWMGLLPVWSRPRRREHNLRVARLGSVISENEEMYPQ